MDPRDYEKPKSIPATDELRAELLASYKHSKAHRESAIEPNAAKSMKILKGIPLEPGSATSKVTGRKKIYFRKVWSIGYRLAASFFQSFLQDKNKVKINGRDANEDWQAAKVLEFMTRYHLERLMRRHSAFKKLMSAFMNCFSPGIAVIKLFWNYNEDTGKDEPDFCVYPIEQVCLDWEADCLDEMRFIFFENYVTKDKLEEMGYDAAAVKKAVPTNLPESMVRSVRYTDAKDPLVASSEGQNYSNGTVGSNYPEKKDELLIDQVKARYLSVEGFYKKKGKIYSCVLAPASDDFFKKPELSVYGDLYPAAIGSMLIEPHKLIAESLPEVLAGPQESLNFNLNVRKDATLLAMMPIWVYGRFAGVDKQALRNLRPGAAVAANDPSQVVSTRMTDVGQNSYNEAASDISIIEEESGVNQSTLGQSSTGKTGEAQINLSQGSAKLDLYSATVGHTLFHQFVYILAYMIQRFETNEKLFRDANADVKKDPKAEGKADLFNLDFDMDLETEVGATEIARQVRSARLMMIMDRMLQANNSTFMAMKAGIQMQNPKIFDIAEVGADLFPELGMNNVKKYLVQVAPPPPEQQPAQGGGGKTVQSVEGQNAAQPNEATGDTEFMQNLMQQIGGGQ